MGVRETGRQNRKTRKLGDGMMGRYRDGGRIIAHMSTCVAMSTKRQTSDLNVTDSRPTVAKDILRYVLLVNSPSKLNLLSRLLIYVCNK